MSRLLKINEEEAIHYIQLFQLYQIYFDPLSEYSILKYFLILVRLKNRIQKQSEVHLGILLPWNEKCFQYTCVALEDKMAGRNLCQFDLIADKKPRANKQLSIAKIKISRVIAYSLKPKGKKCLSVCSTSCSVLRWNTLNVAAQMQLDFIHAVPSQPRLKRLSQNTGPDRCSGT